MRAAALACFLALLVCGRADIISTPVEFVEVNANEFQVVAALLERANLVDALSSDLPNTYFLPTDNAFILDFAQTSPLAADGGSDPSNPNRREYTVEQIVELVRNMPIQAAVDFVKAHVAPTNYPNVTALAYPNGVVGPETDVIIKNSLAQDVYVAYDQRLRELKLTIEMPDSIINSWVAGPVAIPAGDSTMYVLLNLMAEPSLIIGNSTAAAAPAPAKSSRR